MRKEQFGKVTIYQGDCMELMAGLGDKSFDLAVVDPPYGIGMSGGNVGYKGNNNLERKEWDLEIPRPEYFSQIKRISINRIIWGGNYFPDIWPSRCYLVWDKGAGFKGRTYAESELAYTSFDQNAKTFHYDPLANRDYRGKIHPTQKPVKLYEWIFANYAKPEQRILDTHLGSASSAIAAYYFGCEFVGIELDADYFDAACKRLDLATRQEALF